MSTNEPGPGTGRDDENERLADERRFVQESEHSNAVPVEATRPCASGSSPKLVCGRQPHGRRPGREDAAGSMGKRGMFRRTKGQRLLPRQLRARMRIPVCAAAVGLACAVGNATWWAQVAYTPLPLPLATLPPEPPRASSKTSLTEILRLVHRIHPPGPSVPREVAPTSQEAVRPPLSAFEVSMLVLVDAAKPRVVITCRDPAHPESYCLALCQPDRETSLREAQSTPEGLRLEVARGAETHTFLVPRAPAPVPMLARIVGGAPGEPEDPTQRRPHVPSPQTSELVCVKGVPYYEGGRVVGYRVTGVRPDSWATTLGIVEGDVIRAVDRKPLDGAEKIDAWRSRRFVPDQVEVSRSEAGKLASLSLTERGAAELR